MFLHAARGETLRWPLIVTALLAPLAPAALLAESYVPEIVLNWIESICVQRIGGIAALTNALTLMP